MTDEEKETFLILKGWKCYPSGNWYNWNEGWWDPSARKFKVLTLNAAYELALND